MKIGFIGAGNMGRAIASGLASQENSRLDELICISGTGSGARLMAEQSGARMANSKEQLIAESDIVILAFKPQHLETITEAEANAAKGKLIVSILAGRTLDSMQSVFPDAENLARVMPNTPSQIGKGVSTYCFLNTPSDEEERQINDILSSLGSAYLVKEEQLHIATVINGCGPALFFRIIQLLAESAGSKGLDKDLAIKLAAETGIGSLELLLRSGKDPQSLIDEVVSPNGVTHALLTSLDQQSFPKLLDTAVQDAVDRSIELSRNR